MDCPTSAEKRTFAASFNPSRIDPCRLAIFVSSQTYASREFVGEWHALETTVGSSQRNRIAAHISAGARLRRTLPNLASDDLANGADATLLGS